MGDVGRRRTAPAAPGDGEGRASLTTGPITAETLADFYKQFADPHFSGTAVEAQAALRAAGARLSVVPEPARPCPQGMDEGMFAARCCAEEGVEALKGLTEQGAVDAGVSLSATMACFQEVQDSQRANTTAVIEGFLPADFRRRIFRREKQRREKKNADEVAALIRKGGSVRDKYDLLWKQQWARRELLGSISSSTGIWKSVVKFVAGVPEDLLAVAKSINAKDGPTAQVRVKFLPTLERLVLFAGDIAHTAMALRAGEGADDGSVREAVLKEVARCSAILLAECKAFVALLDEVIQSSPFTLSPDNVRTIVSRGDEDAYLSP